jgi:hypothetical protein
MIILAIYETAVLAVHLFIFLDTRLQVPAPKVCYTTYAVLRLPIEEFSAQTPYSSE